MTPPNNNNNTKCQHVLSIQSHVVWGHAGNSAAILPMQRMGINVNPIHTVHFSNHTGYGHFLGEIMPPSIITDSVQGLEENGFIHNINAVLSGYTASPLVGETIASAVQKVRSHNADAIYCCDPVLGDVGRGIYVRDGVADMIKHTLVPIADIITPNHFEAEFLSGHALDSVEKALQFCDTIIADGTSRVVITSFNAASTPAGTIQCIAADKHGKYILTKPKVTTGHKDNFTGSGDVFTSLFLASTLQGKTTVEALEHTASAIHAIYEVTAKNGRHELDIISAQDYVPHPPTIFSAEKL